MLFRLGCLTLPAFDSFFQCGPLITCVSSLGLEQARYFIGSDLDQKNRSGLVVECLTRDRGAAGSSLTDVTPLCP